MSAISVRSVRWVAVIVLVFLVLGTGCSGNERATSDLPESAQKADVGDAEIIVNPDQFPNVAHKCKTFESGITLGFWTTTDRMLIIIFNDWSCPGSNTEKEMVTINGVPRGVVQVTG